VGRRAVSVLLEMTADRLTTYCEAMSQYHLAGGGWVRWQYKAEITWSCQAILFESRPTHYRKVVLT
jgi:hypothetical protein